jgi:hypothetical protein
MRPAARAVLRMPRKHRRAGSRHRDQNDRTAVGDQVVEQLGELIARPDRPAVRALSPPAATPPITLRQDHSPGRAATPYPFALFVPGIRPQLPTTAARR